MIAEADRLPLDDQDPSRVERTGACLAIRGERDLSRRAVARALDRQSQPGREGQRGFQSLAGAAEGGRLLGQDLLFGAPEGFLPLAHAGASTTPPAISSAMRSSL